jgi:hypothetical protein
VDAGSLPRFFERVTKQSFRDLTLDDPPALAYLTELLTRFARTEALYTVRGLPTKRLDTMADALLAIDRAWNADSPEFQPEAEQALRRHIGDYTLFMTGVFREYVDRLAVTGLYEREGRRAYQFVAETARARGQAEAHLFRRLSDRFEQYTGALSYARKVYFPASEWPPRPVPADPLARMLWQG